MNLETNNSLGHGGNGFQGTGTGSAAKMIKELQGLTIEAVAGAGADTDIAVTGIDTTDTLVAVINVTDGDNPAGISVTSTGNIQSTETTAGDTLTVYWFQKPV